MHSNGYFASRKIIVAFVMLALVRSVAGEIKVCPIFGDNMVIQQDANIPVWGWADNDEKITVSGSWSKDVVSTTAGKDGRWTVKLKSPKAGGTYELKIQGSNQLVFKNVMAGEVWVCGGQSNMSFELSRCSNAASEIAKAANPKIRLFKVISPVSVLGQASDQRQTNCEGQWQECTPETAAKFSGVSYFFGRELTKALNIPVGLVQVSVGGTAASSWMSQETLKSDPAFEPILKTHTDLVAGYPQAKQAYDEKLKAYDDRQAKAKADGSEIKEESPKAPLEPYHFKRPSALYNRYVAPIQPYGIRGVIWYQGESDAGRWMMYRKLFPALIRNWRQDWGQGDFPFLFVQYAGFDDKKANKWPLLRESQAMALSVPNTAMATAIDVGEPNNIHPPRKQEVGDRLALVARAKVYGEKIEYSGPIFKRMEIKDREAVIEFTHIGSGLEMRGTKLTGFQISGQDKHFVNADARLDKQNVIVSSPDVVNPVAVRYAWHRYPQCSLYNKEGLPAPPFRTDDWLDPNMLDNSENTSSVTAVPKDANATAEMQQNPSALPSEVKVTKDIDYLGDDRKEKLDLYYPAEHPNNKCWPAVVIIHGGGWVEGDKVSKRDLNIASNLVKAGFVCASINYKLGPKSWPQNLYDCKTAVRFLRANANQYNIDPNHIGVIGGSAGGHLATMVGLTGDDSKLDPGKPYASISTRVQAVVDLYGVTNLLTRQETTSSGKPTGKLKDATAPRVLGCGRAECPELWKQASPINHVSKDDPPFLIFHGTADTTVDYEQSNELAQRLKEVGVEYHLQLIDGAPHTFDLESSGTDLRKTVIDFFNSKLRQ
jgi:sialate O-acetylesterase